MMNITVTGIDEYYVRFSSELGQGGAIWDGEQPLPGDCYDVELSIDENFTWGKNINGITKDSLSAIECSNGLMFFIAKVISYEDDGVLTVSLGGDIIFLEVSSFSKIHGYVSFFTPIDKVSIYPINL